LELGDQVLGAGDVLNYVGYGRNNYATLTDLPRARLIEVLDTGLAPVLREMSIAAVIVDRHDSEGALPMLAGLAEELDRDSEAVADPFAALDNAPDAARLLDNGRFAAYRLETVSTLDQGSWPEWSKVLPVWDRSGLMTNHPTPARIKVTSRPPWEGGYIEGVERTVAMELSDLPGGEDYYDLEILLFDAYGEELWSHVLRVGQQREADAPGIRVYRLTVDRSQHVNTEAIVVPPLIQGVRLLKVKAVPIGGAQPLYVLVRLPTWW